jgi:hypothetical protein
LFEVLLRDNYSEMPFTEGRGVSIADSYLAYLIVSAVTAAILLGLLLIYACKFYPSVPITGILALLIFNDLLQIIFEMGSYFQQPPVLICIVSIIGTTFFRLAACMPLQIQIIGSSSSLNSSIARRLVPISK